MEIYFNEKHWNHLKDLVSRAAILEDRLNNILSSTGFFYHTSEVEKMFKLHWTNQEVLSGQSARVIRQRWAHAVDKLKQSGVYPYSKGVSQ